MSCSSAVRECSALVEIAIPGWHLREYVGLRPKKICMFIGAQLHDEPGQDAARLRLAKVLLADGPNSTGPQLLANKNTNSMA